MIRQHLSKDLSRSIMNGLSFGITVSPLYQYLTLSSFSNQTEHENIRFRFYIDSTVNVNVTQKQYTFDPSAPSHSLRMKLHSLGHVFELGVVYNREVTKFCTIQSLRIVKFPNDESVFLAGSNVSLNNAVSVFSCVLSTSLNLCTCASIQLPFGF